jgi:hypothetical protein
MRWIVGSALVWVLLRKEFATYKAFATTANPSSTTPATPANQPAWKGTLLGGFLDSFLSNTPTISLTDALK